MTLYAGMSGWAYPEWRPDFYPAGTQSAGMLALYSKQFNTVEINNTYYRMPSASALTGWTEQVPPAFQFAFKANQGITHTKEFASRTDRIDYFCDLLSITGSHLGPVLFQLGSRADLPQLSQFFTMLRPKLQRIVVEFRHKSWFTDDTYEILRANDVALCRTETDDGWDPELSASDFSYVRLRKTAYTFAELNERMEKLDALASNGHDVFCYLKHEVENAVLLRQFENGTGS
jgi:uncharacterized protein YecE (DUF72 family)